MRLIGRVVERDLRKRGALQSDEVLVAGVAAELISAHEGTAAVSDGERFSVMKLRFPVGMPAALGYTERRVIIYGKKFAGYSVDLVQLAGARQVEEAEIELFIVADPPRRFRLKLANTALAVATVHEIMQLRRTRLDEQTQEHQAHFLLQEGDVFAKLGEQHPAAAAYETVAAMGVPGYSSTGALNYGILLRRAGAEEEAGRFLTQAQETGNDDVAGRAAMNLGLICVRRDDTQGARRHFEEAVLFGNELAAEALRRLDK